MSWRVTNGSGASHDRRVSRPRLAASAILTCAVVLSAAAGSPGAAALRANHVGTRDRVFRNHGVRLTYPTEWRAYTYADDASSFSAAVVYLSNRRLHEPCVIRTAAPITRTCGLPLGRLDPASILVSWRANGFPGWSFARAKGRLIRVDGHRARLKRENASCGIHADLEMDVVIQRHAADNWYAVTACIRGPHTAHFARQFTTLLRTARVSG